MRRIELRETRAPYAITLDDLVQSSEPVVIERDGKPLVVVVPYALYQQLTAPPKPKESRPNEVFERNRAAYYAMKAELLKTHRGKFVAFHDGQFVDSDSDEPALVERVYARFGYGKLLICPVEEPERVYRIPGPRLVRNK